MLKEMLKIEKDPAQLDRSHETADFVSEIVDSVMRKRKSTRAFLPDPVSSEEVRDILAVAARAPSGTNIQPWNAYWVDQAGVDRVYRAIETSGIKPERAKWTEYQYYPDTFSEVFLDRRRKLGKALYELLGISKRDTTAMRAQFMRNYRFFDAPVGVFITIDRDLAVGSWLDLGMFIQNVLLAAQARGISSCPIAAFAPFHEQVRSVVDIPDQQILVCGIALGYPDPTKPENKMQTPRAALSEWIKFPHDLKIDGKPRHKATPEPVEQSSDG